MLSDEVLEKVIERVVVRMQELNTNILKQIGKNIDEIGKLKPSDAQKLVQVLKYGGDYDKIVQELARITKLNTKDIKEIFEEVARNDYQFAKQFYDFRGVGYIPYDENVALQSEVKAIANITARRCSEMLNPKVLGFGLLDKKTGEIEFKGLKKAYYDLLDEAVLSVSQGKESFDDAMTRQIKQMGSGGLKVIYDSTYINKDGIEVHNSRRLDSAIRMNLKDSLRELHNETQSIFGDEFNSDGVEISVHENPAPDHALVQGRQFSNIEFEKFQNDKRAITYDGIIFEPEFEGHDRRSISEYNCYHYTFSIVLGVSQPEYTNEQLQEIIDRNEEGFELDGKHYTKYEGTQLQRKLETEIRKQKDIQIMARESGQDDLVRESQKKITQLTKKYKELSDKAGLHTKMKRLKVSGYKRVKISDKNTTKQTSVRGLEEWQDYFGKKYGSFDLLEGKVKYDKNKPTYFTLSENLSKVDKDLLNKNLEQLDKLTEKYKTIDKASMTLDLDTRKRRIVAYTSYDGRKITLSKSFFEDKEKYINAQKKSLENKWHTNVKEENLDVYTITHEYGHVIEDLYIEDYQMNSKSRIDRETIDNNIKYEILNNVEKETKLDISEIKNEYFSGYAKSRKNFEWFAETFTMLELGEENPLTKAMEKWLKENVL